MASCSFFEEDVVYVYNKKTKTFQYGLVVENYDLVSSDEDEDSENNRDKLQKDTVRVAWYPSGVESIVSEKKAKLADRSLMPGDVVRRLIPGQDSQCGYVLDTDIRCHLHIKGSNKYIYNVNAKDLEHIQPFETGQDVVLKTKLGRVSKVQTDIFLHFSDGAKCRVKEVDLWDFEDAGDRKRRHGMFATGAFYEGQLVSGPFECLETAEWTHSTPRHNAKMAKAKWSHNVTALVHQIIPRSVEVNWRFNRPEEPNECATEMQKITSETGEDLKKLKVMNCFAHCSIVLGDHMMYRIKNSDVISTAKLSQSFDPELLTKKDFVMSNLTPFDSETETATINTGADATASEQSTNNDTNVSEAAVEANDDMEDDSGDSDGSEEGAEADSKNAPVGHVSMGTQKAMDKRMRRGGHKAYLKGAKPRSGWPGNGAKRMMSRTPLVAPDSKVPVEVEFACSWATIMWQDGTVEYDIPSLELFPVHHLDELEFFPGDFVEPSKEHDLKPDYGYIISCDHTERTCLVNWFSDFDVSMNQTGPRLLQGNAEVSVYDLKDHDMFNFRPSQTVVLISTHNRSEDPKESPQSIGQIVKFDPTGQIEIKWSEGVNGLVYPQEVFRMPSEDDEDSADESWEDSDSEVDSTSSWQTESEEEVIGGEEADEQDDLPVSTTSIQEQRQELNMLLVRAESALCRLQTLLNSFNFTVSPPECYQDILRIYRSFHNVDKILHSSFLSDPELQSLISFAKTELKRDKATKMSRQLDKCLESWGIAQPKTCCSCKHKVPEAAKHSGLNGIATTMTNTEQTDELNQKKECCGAAACKELLKVPSGDNVLSDGGPLQESQPQSENTDDKLEMTGSLRKEFSAPVISDRLQQEEESAGTSQPFRRPSDPALEVDLAAAPPPNGPVNLVGENCVSKATKRCQSDSLDCKGECPDEKKSRDDNSATATCPAKKSAQDVCYQICTSLHKHVLQIYQEVNKRAGRLAESESKDKEKKVEEIDQGSIVGLKDSESVAGGAAPAPVTNNGDSGQPQECLATDKSVKQNGASEQGNPVEETETDDSTLTEETVEEPLVHSKGFFMSEEVGLYHKYISQVYEPFNPRAFKTSVTKEMKLLHTTLPDGIHVKGFQDRLDLYSVMILGPEGTPYEDGIFLFDLMLPKDYPNSPPLCHYYSFCQDRLNPNLYQDGKVCVSLLGTWSGKGSEMWTSKSNILQVLLSIQGLILVPEPYFNEAGYERQRGTQLGRENSRVYNEMALVKTVQSLSKMCQILPAAFQEEIQSHLILFGPRIIRRLRKWLTVTELELKDAGNCSQNLESTPSTLASDGSTASATPEEKMETVVVDKLNHLQVNGNALPILDHTSGKGSNSSTSPDKDLPTSSQLEQSEVKKSPSRTGLPDFPLLPITRGLRLALTNELNRFEKSLEQLQQKS